jgi:hypothetical protein
MLDKWSSVAKVGGLARQLLDMIAEEVSETN